MGEAEHEPTPRRIRAPAASRAQAGQVPAPPGVAALALRLQRAGGNRATAAVLRSRHRGPRLQRSGLYPFKGAEQKPLTAIGEHVYKAVQWAVTALAADATLTGKSIKAGGYLASWIGVYKEFVANPMQIPSGYYTRYGYAVETLATELLGSISIAPYRFQFQISHGHTRPDIVVVDAGNAEIAWIDITSEGSPNHIKGKQGAGWTNRSYVAEVRYDMPSPAELAKSQSQLDPETKKLLDKADAHQAQQAKWLEAGLDAFATELGSTLYDAWIKKGEGLAAGETRALVRDKANALLGDVNYATAKSILWAIDEIEVGGKLDTGASWARWAFGNDGQNGAAAKERLTKYGSSLG